MKYKKKPNVTEAVKWTGENLQEVCDFIGKNEEDVYIHDSLYLADSRGILIADIGDYVVKDKHGEFYLCKASIFEDAYEPAE